MPLISVIVPVYKVEAYLPACVDSILSQTFSNFELILVDDGSPDACGAMCDSYAREDSRIRVIHQKNGGLSAARNAGLDIAKGEYVTFVDSDDVIAPDCLQVFTEVADETDADVVVGSYIEFSDDSDLKGIWAQLETKKSYRIENRYNACEALYLGNSEMPINAWGKLYKTGVINSRRFPVGRIHEDQAFVPRIIYTASSIVILDKVVYGYRYNEDGITHSTFSNRRYDDIWVIDQCIAFFEDNGEMQIALSAKRKRNIILAKYSILARSAGVIPPKEYRVSLFWAIRCLKKGVSAERFEYYLGVVHPKLPLVFEYDRKIRKIVKGE